MEEPLKILKTELPYNPPILHFGVYPKAMKSVCGKDIYTLIFITVLFTIAKMQNQPECPSNR
jgi:hypothetical protein